jgi:RNA polymerase sigma-70 factor, ECF subfamily
MDAAADDPQSDSLASLAGPALSRSVQDHLGRALQALFEESDPNALPENLRALIQRLEAALGSELTDAAFREALLKALPKLRAYAISLTRNGERADDLVQETILKAWDKRSSFQPGTNLPAWLFTIQRNGFHSEHRKRQREVEDADGVLAGQLTTIPDQLDKLHVQDLGKALLRLSADQREAILLVGAEGLSYEEAAAVCDRPVGTIKSRVNRARSRLVELMGYTGGDLAAVNVMQAALTSRG